MWRALRSISLTKWIFIGMGVGILVGWVDNLSPDRDFTPYLKPLSTIFLRMIKSIVVTSSAPRVGMVGAGTTSTSAGSRRSIGYFWV
jgi:Na+/H+-dicarboxylate symporter